MYLQLVGVVLVWAVGVSVLIGGAWVGGGLLAEWLTKDPSQQQQ